MQPGILESSLNRLFLKKKSNYYLSLESQNHNNIFFLTAAINTDLNSEYMRH